jgi:hypothetical protein
LNSNRISIEITCQWLLIFIIQDTRKTSKVYLKANRKGGTFVLCLTILIKMPFYLKICWTCGIVKLVTTLELLRWRSLMDLILVWHKLVMIVDVINIICQYIDNDSNMRQILMKKATLVIGRWNTISKYNKRIHRHLTINKIKLLTMILPSIWSWHISIPILLLLSLIGNHCNLIYDCKITLTYVVSKIKGILCLLLKVGRILDWRD